MSFKTYNVNGKTIIRKKEKRFIRHQSDRFKRVSAAWRRPRGIDSAIRRKFRGQRPMPNIGYGNAKATKHMCKKDGLYEIRIFNIDELEALLMHNDKFAVVLAKSLSAAKRMQIVERCDQLKLRVRNRDAKVRVEEQA
ncbi:MAG: uncharacterized protein KVP18_002058 [Porospora cf. gigantea A]|uniref:uncharacterized protein n=1 Tax=Porospora cf. gigantea A TaxID=2853593 RepID=UPI00355A238D|nr:MAG: hypothetical protein KVP18_002058 [Porospora cf. gigantea A]